MRITSLAIKNFSNINDFATSAQWIIRASDPNTLYFQLYDLDNVEPIPYAPMNGGFFGGLQNTPQRYIAGVGTNNQPVVLTVTFPSLCIGKTLIFTATQDPNDGSVFSISLPGYTNTALAPSSGNVIFNLTQGINTVTWVVRDMLAIEVTNQGCC